MPQHKSAIKSVRQNKQRRIINRQRKGNLKASIKNVILSIEGKNEEVTRKEFTKAISVIDRMASKGVIHKNNAARKKSRLWQKIKSMEAKTQSTP